MHKTEFLTKEGLYKYVVILFRLCNAPETFQRLMNLASAAYINDFATIHLDDILLYSEIY